MQQKFYGLPKGDNITQHQMHLEKLRRPGTWNCL